MLTFKRTLSGRHIINKNGVEIGDIYKYTRGKGFGMSLTGIYFRRGEPNTVSGSVGTSFARLMDAKVAVEGILLTVGK